jgi:hypothetical protein
MPFGVKEGIDFNRVYRDLIQPALDDAGFAVFRADEETRAGEIRTDMFQELLVADLVVADLTLDNPNVWYELGVRHALRARGVVLVCGGKVTTAFDLYTDRKLRYALKDGVPDPATLDHDRQALTRMAKATLESWHGRKVSPVYHLLPHLQEPDWKSLRIGNVREFWERHEAWAIIRAQSLAASETAQFISSVGLEPPAAAGGQQAARMVKFSFDRKKPLSAGEDGAATDVVKTESVELTVPLLTIVPIPYIRIELATIDFECKVSSSTLDTSQHNVGVEAKASGGFWGVKFSVKASYSYQKTHRDQVDKSATLKVHIKAVQDEMPGGLSRMLEILETAINDTATDKN